MFTLKSLRKTILLGVILTFGSHQIASANILKINDISSSDPRIGIYGDLVNSKAISLDKLGNFNPDLPINKAGFLKAALVYAGFTPGQSFNFETGFLDVPAESWFAPYVKKAINIRVFETPGKEARFNPADQINRQEALLIALKIYGIPTPLAEPTSKQLYNDIRLNHPLANVYMAAFLNSIYFEQDQRNFRPNKILTRGDAADLLFKTKLAIDKGATHYDTNVIAEPAVINGGNSGSDLMENDKFNILLDTWNKIKKQYVYTDKVNSDKLVYGAIAGMVDQLDDPYSNFKSPNEDGQTYIYIPENYEGIGAVIDRKDENYIIQTTINNSPAYRAGLKAMDIIVSLDGKEINNLTTEQVTSLIKGKAGTYLKLQVKRNNQILDFDIVREKINLESMHYSLLDNSINYLRIDQFTENSYQDFGKYLEEIKKSASQKLIIDLRNNPGGYLSSTQNILSHFLDAGQIEFYTQDKNLQISGYQSNGNGELKDYKMVVLINEGSASASEIMAGALQDSKLAYLIGSKSFGKGSVQEITNYNDNSSLKLTIAQWLTPNKRNINHLGLVPDQTVGITDLQKANGDDPQLDAAKNYLR